MPTHAEKRFLPHSPGELFSLVADVESYPKFLPWCLGARVRKRDRNANGHEVLTADLIIGFKMLREKYTSRVTLVPDQRVDVEYIDGPFHYLNNHWLFEPAEGGTILDFYVDFEFRNRLLQSIMGALFNEAVKRMVAAFETRAGELYGINRQPTGKPTQASPTAPGNSPG